MSPQPKQKSDEPTAEEVARDRTTPEPAENAQTFTVEDLRQRGQLILGGQLTLPDILAALSSLPKTRELTVKDARKRVQDWLDAPVSTEPPLEG